MEMVLLTPDQLEALVERVVGRCRNLAPPAPPPDIIDTKTLCERLNLSENTVIKYRKRGRIPSFPAADGAIRYDYNEVIAALKSPKK